MTDTTAPATGPTPGRRLIIVSNRLPVTVTLEGGCTVVRPSVGGLATGLRGPHERSGGVWVGWPGLTREELDAAGHALEVERQCDAIRVAPVSLSASELNIFYERVSNAVLWPVCHDRLDQLPLRMTGWDVYERAT
jgi:trehalose 6-phosphate synthase/phosphatase